MSLLRPLTAAVPVSLGPNDCESGLVALVCLALVSSSVSVIRCSSATRLFVLCCCARTYFRFTLFSLNCRCGILSAELDEDSSGCSLPLIKITRDTVSLLAVFVLALRAEEINVQSLLVVVRVGRFGKFARFGDPEQISDQLIS